MRKRNKQIIIRLSEHEKELLKKTGYKPYEIIKMFLDKYYNNTPLGLAIELDLLKKEKDEMINKQITIDNKINNMEKQISKFNNLDLVDDSTIIAIKDTIKHYLNKQIAYNSIIDFLDNSDELVKVKSSKTGYDVEEFIKLVIDYYTKHYN